MSRTFVTTSSSSVKLFALFGPTSCSAKVICSCRGSGTFEKNEGSFEPAFVTNELRKKQRCVRKKQRCIWIKRRAIGECVCLRSCSHLGAFACVSWRNKRIAYWRSRCIYTGFRMDSHIFLSPKKFTGPEWGPEWGPK